MLFYVMLELCSSKSDIGALEAKSNAVGVKIESGKVRQEAVIVIAVQLVTKICCTSVFDCSWPTKDLSSCYSAHLYQVFIVKRVFVKRFLSTKPDFIFFLSDRCDAEHRTELQK